MAQLPRGSGPKWSKSDGKQGVERGGDFGARKMAASATMPAWLKAETQAKNFTPYKGDKT